MLSDGGHVVLLVSLLEPPAGLRVVELSPTVGVAAGILAPSEVRWMAVRSFFAAPPAIQMQHYQVSQHCFDEPDNPGISARRSWMAVISKRSLRVSSSSVTALS